MPTPVDPGQKTAFIAIVNAVNPREAMQRLNDLLVNYEDLPMVIGRQLDLFAENPGYLKQAMAVFAPNDADLMIAGVYVNKNSSDPLVDPYLIINSVYSGGVTMDANTQGVALLGASTIDLLTISAHKPFGYLYMGPGSKIKMLDSTADGASIANITLAFAKSTPSEITEIKINSTIGRVTVEDGSVYGVEVNIDPSVTCDNPVTDLAASDITHDTVKLTWTLPDGGYVLIDVFFKKEDSGVWLKATGEIGDYISDEGFIFRQLEEGTKYTFKVVTTCINGATATPDPIDATTTCCGPILT